MKKLLFIILAIIPLFSFSQVNKSIVDTTKQWNNLLYSGGWNTFAECTRIYKLEGDTILNNKTYNKVYSTFYFTHDTTMSIWTCDKFIREDSNIVYLAFSDTTYGKEFVIYNFNLGIGDEIELPTIIDGNYFHDNNFTTIVNSVDSIEINGVFLKRIIFDDSFFSWIEGIGSTQGFLESGFIIDYYSTSLLCVHQNEELIYMDTNSNSCIIALGINDIEKESLNAKIYPTIVNDILRIETQDNDIKELEIVDVLGRFVKREFVYNNKQVNCSQLNSGIYNCIINTKDNKRIAKKFIKQ